MTNWVSQIDHHDAWRTMMWFMCGSHPHEFETTTIRGICKHESEFMGYGLLEKVNERNKQDGPLPNM